MEDPGEQFLSSGTWEAQSHGIAEIVASQNLGMPGILDPQDVCPQNILELES